MTSNQERLAVGPDPYSERPASLGGVRIPTHTQPDHTDPWMVTDGLVSGGPRPFGAKGIPAAVAVTVMLVVTLSAFVASLLVITDGHDRRGWLIAATIIALVTTCAAMAAPGMARSARYADSERSSR